MLRTVCVQFYTVRTGAAQALSSCLNGPVKMAAQTSRMESVALSRVSEAPATTIQKAMEILVYSGQGEAVIAALDEAQQSQQADDNLARLCQQTLDHIAREKVDRAAVGEQLLRKAPADLVGEIQGFAAPAPTEPRRVRQKRERDAAEANERRNERRSVAARPLLELLRSRRHEGHVNIKSVEAVLLDAAEDEPLDADAIDSRRLLSCAPSDPVGAWLDAVTIPRPPAAGEKRWVDDFGYGMEHEAISLLYAACSLGDLETVKLFLRHGACVHAGSRYNDGGRDNKGHPLEGALGPPGRSPECALAILDAWTVDMPTGVDGYPDSDGSEPYLDDDSTLRRNPLHDACRLDDDADALAVAKKLVALGARVDATTGDSLRPLHLACERGHAKLVAFLLREGADPAAPGDQFEFDDEANIDFMLQLNAVGTPLEVCEAHGYDDCAALIRKALGKAAPKEPTTPEDYRRDLAIVRAHLGRNFWRYYGLKGKGIGHHRRIASDDAFPETTPSDVDAAFRRLKDQVFELREYQARLREPELYAKWEAWEKSEAGLAWRRAGDFQYDYASDSDSDPFGRGDY